MLSHRRGEGGNFIKVMEAVVPLSLREVWWYMLRLWQTITCPIESLGEGARSDIPQMACMQAVLLSDSELFV